jgi:PEP-CTERM motif
MRLRTLALVAALGTFVIGSTPASAGLVGLTVGTVSYLDVSNPPPPGDVTNTTTPTPDCTTILYCSQLIYPTGPSSSRSFPLPVVPVGGLSYSLDALTETFVTISDDQITITNNLAAPFCFTSTCAPGQFSGFGFYFSGGADISGVSVDPSSSADFRPIANGLSSTATSILVNLNGTNPVVGDALVLDVFFAGSVSPGVPEPSTWALMLLGFAGLGVARYRRSRGAARA